MIDLERYRLCIRQLLSERARLAEDDCIQAETIFDRARDRYLLVRVGWFGDERIYNPILHIDICGKQVWIQQDETAAGIASELVDRGIPAQAIVLGFSTAIAKSAVLQA